MNLKIKASNYLNIFKHPLMGVSIHNWVRILAKNKFRVHIFFIPKALFITMTALINAPLQFTEHLVFSKRIKRQKVESPVFILGHMRSGTTYLHYLMSKDPQFGFCTVYNAILPHVFLTGGKLFKRLIASSLDPTRPQDNVEMSIDSPKEEEFAMANMSKTSFMFGFYFPKRAQQNFEESVVFKNAENERKHWKRYFNFFLRKLTFTNKGKGLLLKSPANTGRVKEILELFPDAKFIHIHRDPLEVYQSTIRLYEKIVPITTFQHANEEEMKEYILKSYTSMFEKYFEDRELLGPDQLVEVSYADLVAKPQDTLEGIYSKLQLTNFSTAAQRFKIEAERTQDYEKNTYSTIDDVEREMLKKRWGATAEKLGYPL